MGDAVFIRTVTHYHTGRIVGVTPTEIHLVDAAWIASTGRFATALATGALDEVEPYPASVEPVVVCRGAIVDYCHWPHALPTAVK